MPFRPIACVVLALLLAACGGGGDPAPASVNVGGTLSGLGAGKTVVIAEAGGASASLSANGAYSLQVAQGVSYSLRIQTQPAGQTCTIANGAGTATADVNNIAVTCQDTPVDPQAKTVRGTVAGAGGPLVLQLNAQSGVQETGVKPDGTFEFADPVTGEYTLTVKTAPTGQVCTVNYGPPITIACVAASQGYKLGGTVSGNTAAVAIRNTANGDAITLITNGTFSFAQPVVQGSSYSVVVFEQSANQTCSVANGSGVANADVSNIQVSCVAIAPPPVAVPSVPAGLTMTYGVKTFNLAWSAVTAPSGGGAVSYRVFEDADGTGPAAAAQIGGSLATTAYTHMVAGLLHTRLNAQYTVQACNSAGCSAPSAPIVPHLTQAIGYFKASNTGSNDVFGSSVALSADGNTLAVGAYGESSNATGVGGDQVNSSAPFSGAVYVFTRSAGVWSQQAYVKASNTGGSDVFGYSVALSADGNTLAVGAIGEDSNATGVDGNQADDSALQSGAVYVFTRTAGAWSQQAYVKASNTGQGDSFGYSVALSADGATLAVGAQAEGSNSTGVNGDQANNSVLFAGAVYVFARSAGVWSQQAYVKASNTEAGDLFGQSVALSADGNTLAVGAYRESSNATGVGGDQVNNSAGQSGAVYVFTRNAGAWSQQAYVKASNTGSGDVFGWSVALSGNGDTLAVGAREEFSSATGVGANQADNSAPYAGAVYVFARSAGVWSQQAYVKASNTEVGDLFGNSVALSADGNTLAVGASGESSNATGVGGNQADNSAGQSGAVYVFTRNAGVWSQQAYVKASNTRGREVFSIGVSLSGDGGTLAVGAFYEDSNATGVGGNQADNSTIDAGAVYIY